MCNDRYLRENVYLIMFQVYSEEDANLRFFNNIHALEYKEVLKNFEVFTDNIHITNEVTKSLHCCLATNFYFH